MSDALRLLVVAEPAAAARVVAAVRQGGPVAPALAPDVGVLRAALAAQPWDAVLVVPGGPLADAAVASVVAGQPPPVLVVGPAVPESLVAVGAQAVAETALAHLADALASSSAPAERPLAPPTSTDPEAAAPTAGQPADPASERPASDRDSTGSDVPRATGTAAGGFDADSLAQHLPIGVYRSTPDGRIVYANSALASILGSPSVEALADVDVQRDLGYPRDAFAAGVDEHGDVRNLVVSWTRGDGRRIVTRENAHAVRDQTGRTLYYEGTMEDVTAEVNAWEAERRRARQHEAVAQFARAADEAETDADLYQAAVDAILAATGADWALLASPERCLGWSDGVPEERIADVERALRRVSIVSEPLALADVQAGGLPWDDPAVADLFRGGMTRGITAYPLFRAGVPLGMLAAGYFEPHVLEDEERRACEGLAWHVAGALARLNAEADLRDSEASLRFIAEHTAHVLYRLRYDPSGGPPTFDYLSPAVEALTGYTPAALEALGGLPALVEEREVFEGEGLADQVVEGAGRYRALYHIRTRDGAHRWVENDAYVWQDEEGQPVGLVGVFHDVTDRKRRDDEQADAAQQALARQAALVELGRLDAMGARTLIERAAELACAVSRVDQSSVWLADGPWMVCRTLCAPGHSADLVTPSFPAEAFEEALTEIQGHRALAFNDVADPRLDALGMRPFIDEFGVRAFLAAPLRSGGAAVGMVVLHRTSEGADWDGTEIEFVAALADAVALALERDERGRAEAALRRSEARYRALAELSSDYAFAVHVGVGEPDRIAWATDAFARVTGYEADEVGTAAGFLALLDPEHRPAAREALDGLDEAGRVSFEAPIRTKSGVVRWVRHHARVGGRSPDGATVVYHSGQDVTDRKRFEAELVGAREEAERAREAALELARLKSAFLANMSHEIRTPLTSILGYADVLAEEVGGEHREFVDSIAGNGRRLLDTLNSVLDLAQLDGGGVSVDLVPTDAAAEVRQAAEGLASLAAQRGLALTVDAPSPAWADLDAACLGRIVTNLTGNAIKFTDAGSVRVSVLPVGEEVHLQVADTGLGIDPAFLPHLFDEFRQETGGERRRYEGSGLGLAITRRLVALMGGRIGVESARPGGTTFTVAFPARLSAVSNAGTEPARTSTARPAPAPMAEWPVAEWTALADVVSERPVVVDPVPPWSAPAEAQVDRSAEALAPSRPPSAGGDGASTAETVLAHLASSGEEERASGASSLFVEAGPETSGLETNGLETNGLETFGCTEGLTRSTVGSAPALADPARAATEVPTLFEADPFDFSFLDDTPPTTPPSSSPSGPPEVPPAAMFDFRFGRSQEPEPAPARSDPGPDPSPPSVPPGTPPAAPAFDAAPESGPSAPRPAEEPVLLVRPAVETPAEPEEEDDGRPYVLVVEDNGDTRMLLQRILRSAYQVTAVGDARSALIAMHKRRFSGLVLDINLGGKETGADVLRIARTLEGYTGVFAIALTAYALPGDRERLLESGFDEYISKPFTRQSLMSALEAGIRVA